MTAEEQAAVDWLESLPADEHLRIFHPPAGEVVDLFSLKDDHERGYAGDCYKCRRDGREGRLVVIE